MNKLINISYFLVLISLSVLTIYCGVYVIEAKGEDSLHLIAPLVLLILAISLLENKIKNKIKGVINE